MIKTSSPFASNKSLTILSRLLLPPCDAPLLRSAADLDCGIAEINQEELEDMLALANSHHLVMRGFEVFRQIMLRAGDDSRAEWAATALAA